MSRGLVRDLVIQIIIAKRNYYSGNPTMSDYEYDELEKRLISLDPDHPVLFAVGYDPSYEWWIREYTE